MSEITYWYITFIQEVLNTTAWTLMRSECVPTASRVIFLVLSRRARGEALRYKPENHEFDSNWGRWDFSLTWPFRLQYGPGVDSTSSRNEYQEYVLATLSVWLTTLPPSCAEWLEILGASNCCISEALSRPVIASYPRMKNWLTIGRWG